MAEPVLAVELIASGRERGTWWPVLRRNPLPDQDLTGVVIEIPSDDQVLLSRLADDRTRYRLTLTPIDGEE